jgi:hypothetical protein
MDLGVIFDGLCWYVLHIFNSSAIVTITNHTFLNGSMFTSSQAALIPLPITSIIHCKSKFKQWTVGRIHLHFSSCVCYTKNERCKQDDVNAFSCQYHYNICTDAFACTSPVIREVYESSHELIRSITHWIYDVWNRQKVNSPTKYKKEACKCQTVNHNWADDITAIVLSSVPCYFC